MPSLKGLFPDFTRVFNFGIRFTLCAFHNFDPCGRFVQFYGLTARSKMVEKRKAKSKPFACAEDGSLDLLCK